MNGREADSQEVSYERIGWSRDPYLMPRGICQRPLICVVSVGATFP